MFKKKRINRNGEIKQTGNPLTSQLLRIEKSGEITSFYLVTLILAIAGFIVVLLLLFSLELETFEADQVCKLSVLSRGTAPIGQGFVPLQCTTKKICVSDKSFGKGNCPQFNGEPEEDILNIKLKGSEREKAEQISEILALGLYNCWTQMGEGKLDLFNGPNEVGGLISSVFVGEEAKPKCVICSRVALADDLIKNGEVVKEKTGILKDVNVHTYLNENGPAGETRSYLQLLTDRQVVPSGTDFENAYLGKEREGSDEIAFVFSQILVPESALDGALSKGANTGIVVGGSLFLSPLGRVTNFGSLYKGLATFIAAGTSTAITYFNVEASQDIAAYHCQGFSGTQQEGTVGCSVARSFDFNNVKKINDFCSGGIEGNP
jgi:hypothetical protein